MSTTSMWAILGIAPTTDTVAIRRAYAAAVRKNNPDDDPAGFASVRAAYEGAMRQARSALAPGALSAPHVPAVLERLLAAEAPAVPEVPAVLDVPGGAPPVPPRGDLAPGADARDAAEPRADLAPAPPGDREQLQVAFAAFEKALTAADTPDVTLLRSLLDACLQHPALDNLSFRISFESLMVHLLLKNTSRALPVLETVVEQWRWRDRGRLAGPGITALLTYADSSRHLAQLETSEPRVHAALTGSPESQRLWTQIILFRLDRAVREEMAQWRTAAPAGTNAEALAWWRRFFERSQLRPELIRATGVFALVGVLFGGIAGLHTGESASHAFTAGVLGLLFGVGVTLYRWALIDWPRYRLAEVRRAGPRWLRIGWAPAALAICIAASLCGVTWLTVLGALLLSGAVVVWASVMAPEVVYPLPKYLLFRAWHILVGNAAIVIWWGLLATVPELAPTVPMWITFLAALLAFTLGQQVLWTEYRLSFSTSGRQLGRGAIAGLALAALLFLVFVPIGLGWAGWLLAGLSAIVLVHRAATSVLTTNELKIRHYTTVGPAVILTQVLSHDHMGPALRVGGMLFMIGVMFSMALCIYAARVAIRQGMPSQA